MLDYVTPLYRPPSEGNNLIIQATIGCSFNRCAFCSMYRNRSFRSKPLEEVFADIDRAAVFWPDAQRVFLADGDALVLPTEHLLRIIEHLEKRLPKLTRVSCYALLANLLKKPLTELTELRANKLSLIYYGIETGHAPLLKRITKGASPAAVIEGLRKAEAAGIKTSATVVLGLAGRNDWEAHIDGTVELLEQAPVNYLSTLQLHLDDSIQEEFLAAFDPPFEMQDDLGMLAEQHRLISSLTTLPKPIIFRSNHASNALALAGILPKDRHKLLAALEATLSGAIDMRPQRLRTF